MNTNDNYNQLLTRVETLERQNRSLRGARILHFALLAGLIGFLMAEHAGLKLVDGKTIRAESIQLKDEEGVVRAELKYHDDLTLLAMYDKHGTPRLSLSVVSGEPGLHVYDEHGFRRGVFGLNQYGPRLAFMNKNSVLGAGLTMLEPNQLGLFFTNSKGVESQRPLLTRILNEELAF